MAYSIKYGEDYLYDPRYEEYVLSDVELELEENTTGYLDFSIPPSHPMYNKIREHDYKHLITVYDDDILLFSGFIYEKNMSFNLEYAVKCKSEFDYLNDTVVYWFSTYDRGWGTTLKNASYSYLFEWLIRQHNSQVTYEKQFVVGINEGDFFNETQTVTIKDRGKDIEKIISTSVRLEHFAWDEISTVMQVLEDVFIGSDGVGGYIRIRHENGIRYIDLLYEWTDANAQILDFGVNITNLNIVSKYDNRISYVIPTGAKLKDTYYSYHDGYSQISYSERNNYTTIYVRDERYFEPKQWNEISKSDLANDGAAAGYYIYEQYTEQYKDDDGTWKYRTSYRITSDTEPVTNKTYYWWWNNRWKYKEIQKENMVDGGLYYVYDEEKDASNTTLTIWALSNGVVKSPEPEYDLDFVKNGYRIYSPTLYEEIGIRGLIVNYPSVKSREELRDLAFKYLYEYSKPKYTIEIKAIDMHFLKRDVKPIAIGEYVRIRSKLHGIDEFFICRNISLDLVDPSQSTFTLGINYDTLTKEQTNKIRYLNAITNKQVDVADKLTETEKANASKAETNYNYLSNVSAEQDAAITSLFEMIVGG